MYYSWTDNTWGTGVRQTTWRKDCDYCGRTISGWRGTNETLCSCGAEYDAYGKYVGDWREVMS